MKRIISTIIISIVLLVTSSVFAAPLEPNQATVKGLSLSSNMEKVLQVMGQPVRTGNWEYSNDVMYEYPGVNFVYDIIATRPVSKIIVDTPQVALDNGLKTGISPDDVIAKLGRSFGFDSVRNEMVYNFVIDPVNYTLGFLTFQIEAGMVKRIIIERHKD